MQLRFGITGQQLALKALEVNTGFVNAHTTENNNDNRSEQIDAIEKQWGLRAEPYCAMGEVHVYAKALAFLSNRQTDFDTLHKIIFGDLKKFFDPSPSCQNMVDAARRRALYIEDISRAKPGDLVFFNFHESAHAEHVEMVAAPMQAGVLKTIGWNTKSGSIGDQREGGGVFARERGRGVILGFLQVNVNY